MLTKIKDLMKPMLPSSSTFRLVISCLAFSVLPVASHGDVIIDTTFANDTDGEAPQTTDNLDDQPFLQPTKVRSGEGSTILVASKGAGDFEEPVAVFSIGGKPEDPEVVSSSTIQWDLRRLVLGPNIYKISYTLVRLDGQVRGARLRIGYTGGDGKMLKGARVHPSAMPGVCLSGEDLLVGKQRLNLPVDQVAKIEFLLDLNQKTWGCTVNDEVLLEDEPIAEGLVQASESLGLGDIAFGSIGGLGDKPGGQYAIGAIKVEVAE